MKQPELNRLLGRLVRTNAKSRGWCSISSQAYWMEGPLLFDLSIAACTRPATFAHSFRVKWLSLDDLLWKILGMPENSRAATSLRVTGAFSVRGATVMEGMQERCSYSEAMLQAKVESVSDQAARDAKWLSATIQTIDDYLAMVERCHRHRLEQHPGAQLNTWVERLLVAISKDHRATALSIAQARIAAGDIGSFISDGTFYERAAKLLSTDA